MASLHGIRRYGAKRALEIYENLGKKNLWQRMLKNTTATTVAVSICLIPVVASVIGKAAYLAAMTTVFGHPGRRFGQLVEALTLSVLGASLGLAWSILGLYLSSLTVSHNPPSAYAIKGVFLGTAVLVHGYLRSYAPRLFTGLILLVIVSAVTLLSTAKRVTQVVVTQILYPILTAIGIILIVNLTVFPEFSSSFLGQATIETLNDVATALKEAGRYFSDDKDHEEPRAEANGSDPVVNDRSFKKQKTSKLVYPQLDGPTISHHSSQYDTDEYNKPRLTRRITSSIGQKVRDMAGNQGAAAEASKVTGSPPILPLSILVSFKGSLRQKLSECKAAQNECNFEVAFSVLPPRKLKFISSRSMIKLVANTVAIISTCESKFALIGDIADESSTEGHRDADGKSLVEHAESGEDVTRAELDLIKPRREIEFGDIRLLRFLLRRVEKPYAKMSLAVFKTVTLITSCIAYTYDVAKLPSGENVPNQIAIEELDEALARLEAEMQTFDADTTSALESAAIEQELEGFEPDIMPREEIFLISSFLLNFTQAATHVQNMLKHCRQLVDLRHQRHGQRRLYAPRIKWASWLSSGGEQDEAVPASGRKRNRQGAARDPIMDEADDDTFECKDDLIHASHAIDVEKATGQDEQANHKCGNQTEAPVKPSMERTQVSKNVTLALRLRGSFADTVEWLQDSDDFVYAAKLTVGFFLVTWPAFVASWNTWFSLSRGVWAALQLIFVTEVSLGTSVWTFIVRGVGTTLGCLWGWAAWEALSGEPVVCAVMICIGIIPSTYVQLGTKYPKAGMVSIISMCVVALSTELGTVPGTATENFLKRWIAFMIGGVVALIVEMVVLPVKARTRLVESISAVLRQISEMENVIAIGIEEGRNFEAIPASRIVEFEHASGKANSALIAAETFLPFCNDEPRIKGSFEALSLIYTEMLFVLHQIVDRMENMLQLRTAYGSGPLEEFNAEIYPYRRNVAGSITITLFAIHGALTTKMPLPQFLPSARLAHLRMVNRVREVVLQSVGEGQKQEEMGKMAHRVAVRRKYMAWNAASAAQAEIIEFLEELIDLTKLIVGANEFQSGLLTRPTYYQYSAIPEQKIPKLAVGDATTDDEARDVFIGVPSSSGGITRRRRATTRSSKASNEESDEVPASLRRIQSRKIEAGIRRQRTNESRNQVLH